MQTMPYTTTSEIRHLYFAGGMVFNLSEQIKFKPNFMTQAVTGAPFQYDLSAIFYSLKNSGLEGCTARVMLWV